MAVNGVVYRIDPGYEADLEEPVIEVLENAGYTVQSPEEHHRQMDEHDAKVAQMEARREQREKKEAY